MYRLSMRMFSSANRHQARIKSGAGSRRNIRYAPLSIPLPLRGVHGMEVVT